jgi:large subunit ribosomal protein L24
MKIRKNDTVKILYGKDAGKTGKVLKVMPKDNKVVVEGLNVFKKHSKGDGRQKQSEIVDLIKPVHVAKVMLICNLCKKPTRISVEKNERICRKCNKKIDTSVKKETPKVEPKKKVIKKKAVKK